MPKQLVRRIGWQNERIKERRTDRPIKEREKAKMQVLSLESMLVFSTIIVVVFKIQSIVLFLCDQSDKTAIYLNFTNGNFSKMHALANAKINACILVLLKEKDLDQFVITIRAFEAHFNSKHNYPYVILNQVELSHRFQQAISAQTNSTVEFGLIADRYWSVPDWIDRKRLQRSLKHIGFSLNYRHMCRFMSGYFFRHRLTLKYDYFMHIDRDSQFPCEWRYDPLFRLHHESSSYDFLMGNFERVFTMPTLWPSIRRWFIDQNQSLAVDNSLRYVSDDRGITLDISTPCIFYNNFEVASFSVFRSEQYFRYFDYLDRTGGFYYERWGDAPVHTYYIVHMLNKSDVKLFNDLAYTHQQNSNVERDCEQKKVRSMQSKVDFAEHIKELI